MIFWPFRLAVAYCFLLVTNSYKTQGVFHLNHNAKAMKKLYYLSSCSTCKRIIKQWGLPRDFDMQDIKSNPLTLEDLNQMHQRSGSYQSLFSRRAKLFHERQLSAEDLD